MTPIESPYGVQGGVLERTPTDAKAFPEMADFIHRHSQGAIPRDRALDVISQIIRDPDAIADLRRDGKRVALGVLIDQCDSEGDAAELTIVGEAWDRPAWDWCLGWAKKRGPAQGRRHIDLPRWPHLPWNSTWVAAQGFRLGYEELKMVSRRPLESTSPTNTERWVPFDPPFEGEAHALLRGALADVPGAIVPSLAVFSQRSHGLEFPPELLIDEGRVAGFVRISRGATHGEVSLIARHPELRGQGLGPRLLRRAIERLQSLGYSSFQLELNAANRRALRLYEQFGFEVVQSMEIHRLPLGRTAP